MGDNHNEHLYHFYDWVSNNVLSVKVISTCLALIGAVVVWSMLHLYNTVWFKSERVRRKLWMQGIKGPSPSLLYGNLPEMQKIQLKALRTATTTAELTTDPDNIINAEIVAHDYTPSLFPYFVQWRKEYVIYGTLYPHDLVHSP
ncbi:cytochrome P450 [Corchorus capsularis]|uniref:Cytochrome P450 n=1 Tax=Corchorus capsularis TaxID=210143 RepID=A0A1R3JTL4_COCAP|nr:cytochrome P450 [Corchorus capsularis]